MGDRGLIAESQGGLSLDSNLQQLRSRFDSVPSIIAAFEALEEHYFVNGEWNELVTLYERRLESPDLDPKRHPKQQPTLFWLERQSVHRLLGRSSGIHQDSIPVNMMVERIAQSLVHVLSTSL